MTEKQNKITKQKINNQQCQPGNYHGITKNTTSKVD
jgi:hypothetical protein